jgi:hypothetical protein
MTNAGRKLRDHSKPCDHAQPQKRAGGYWVCDWCPGGKEIVLRQESVFDIDTYTQRKVWVEVDDE